MSDRKEEWEANETPDLDEDKLWRDGRGGGGEGTTRVPPRSVRAAPQSGGRTWIVAAVVAAVIVAGSAAAYVGLSGLGGTPAVELARIDGSSTVYPITAAWAGEFNTPTRQVVVAFSGTGGGVPTVGRGGGG